MEKGKGSRRRAESGRPKETRERNDRKFQCSQTTKFNVFPNGMWNFRCVTNYSVHRRWHSILQACGRNSSQSLNTLPCFSKTMHHRLAHRFHRATVAAQRLILNEVSSKRIFCQSNMREMCACSGDAINLPFACCGLILKRSLVEQ